MNLFNVYVEPVDPAPPTEEDLDKIIVWYEENIKAINGQRYSKIDPRYA
jgi:hypothetical protein